MEGARLLERLGIFGLLSYGPEAEPIELLPLNVLIGPNASGKSNLIEAISILASAPNDLPARIVSGGGIEDWLWKGGEGKPTAGLDAIVASHRGCPPLRYRLILGRFVARQIVLEEAIEGAPREGSTDEQPPVFYLFKPGAGATALRSHRPSPFGRVERRTSESIEPQDLDTRQSILSQRKDPRSYPEVTYLGRRFSQIRLYREWNLGRYSPPRKPQNTDLPGDFLAEDARNLGLVLNDLEHRGSKGLIVDRLKTFYEQAEDVTTRVHGGTVQLFVHEKGGKIIPATRLSDGTLRYVCLLAILCHPEPPPLVCLEEPELGLHPDILPTIAELLLDASQRTQLIVTTHSDLLVSALSETPEAVVVCEADERGTHLRRLEREPLQEWLAKYSLGDLWLKGQIGGTRW